MSKLKRLYYLKTHKTLAISLLLNFFVLVGVVIAGVLYHREISSLLITKLFERSDSITSYHVTAKLMPYDTQLELDYVRGPEKYKQANILWEYKEAKDNIHIVYNQDNLFFKFNSRQMLDYITTFFASTTPSTISKSDLSKLQNEIMKHPIIAGESYLYLDEAVLSLTAASPDTEKEILESNQLIRAQVIKSLSLRGFPALTKESKNYYLKVPLKIDYETLNSILYPSIKSYLVKNQKTLKDILDQTNIDIYFSKDGNIAKIIVISPPLTKEQTESIFLDKNANTFVDLSHYLAKSISTDPLVLSINFSNLNIPVDIEAPSYSIAAQDAGNSLAAILDPSTEPAPSKYVINNNYSRKSVNAEIFKDFSMVHNMLYRYYNEHGSYPSTLDSLANIYFPGNVPVNAQTGQVFPYSTFDNNQGFLLCPTSDSGREYCYKKFKYNEVN